MLDSSPVDSLTTVHVSFSLPEAAVIQTTLRAHGIPCYALGEQHAPIDWFKMTTLQGIHIRVPIWAATEAFSLFPEFQAPPSKKEIMAEIKSGKGVYARKRILLVHGTILLIWFFLIVTSAGTLLSTAF